MNRRLQCIASHVPDGIGVIDVGTDHGYLPVELLRRGYPGRMIASDIHEGPLDSARRTACEAGLDDRICFQLCDGLNLCPPDDVDCIVIAGMGGDTICGILDRAEWCMDERYMFVLQPMTRAEVLRYWLVNNEFAIVEEDLVEDSGTIYSVFVARFGGNTILNDAELYVGSYFLLQDHPLYPRFLKEQHSRFQKVLRGMEQGRDPADPGRREVICSVISQLEEMMDHGQSQ